MPRKAKGSKCVSAKAVKDIVRKELRNEIEDKVAVIGQTQVDLDTSAIPNGNVSTSSNIIRIFPAITQGDKQYNSRNGNEIRLKHLDVKMLLNFALPDLSTNQNEDSGIGVRVMILKQKDQNSAAGTVFDFQGAKLLENGLSAATAGPQAFTGETFNLVQKINREQFSVRYDKVHYLDATYRQQSGGATAVSQTFLPPTTRLMSKRLTFGKNGLKLTYGDSASQDPTNFPYIMVLGVASTVSGSVPSNNLVRYSYTANAVYTDA